MKKSVKVKIESRIENLDEAGLSSGDIERSEVSLLGEMVSSDGGFLISYSEKTEGGEISSEVTVLDGFVRVSRRGAIESSFDFRRGVSHSSVYSMGGYKFDVKILPKRVDSTLGEDGGLVDLLYNMNIGGADKAVRMKIWIQMN